MTSPQPAFTQNNNHSSLPDFSQRRYESLCYVCLNPQVDERTLECYHVFCVTCLDNFSRFIVTLSVEDLFKMVARQNPSPKSSDSDQHSTSTRPNTDRTSNRIESSSQFDGYLADATTTAAATAGSGICNNGNSTNDITDSHMKCSFSTTSSNSAISCTAVAVRSISPKNTGISSSALGKARTHSTSSTTSSTSTSSSPMIVVVKCPTCLHEQHVESLEVLKHNSKTRNIFLRKMSGVSDESEITCDCCNAVNGIHGVGSGFRSALDEDEDNVDNFAEYYCNKCCVNMCRRCRQQHDQVLLFKEHQVIHVTGKGSSGYVICQKHHKIQCTYFCLFCKIPLCAICVMRHNVNNDLQESRSSFQESSQQQQRQNSKSAFKKSFSVARSSSKDFQNQPSSPSCSSPDSSNNSNNNIAQQQFQQHEIVKIREAFSRVRDDLKIALNMLSKRLDALKVKCKLFTADPSYRTYINNNNNNSNNGHRNNNSNNNNNNSNSKSKHNFGTPKNIFTRETNRASPSSAAEPIKIKDDLTIHHYYQDLNYSSSAFPPSSSSSNSTIENIQETPPEAIKKVRHKSAGMEAVLTPIGFSSTKAPDSVEKIGRFKLSTIKKFSSKIDSAKFQFGHSKTQSSLNSESVVNTNLVNILSEGNNDSKNTGSSESNDQTWSSTSSIQVQSTFQNFRKKLGNHFSMKDGKKSKEPENKIISVQTSDDFHRKTSAISTVSGNLATPAIEYVKPEIRSFLISSENVIANYEKLFNLSSKALDSINNKTPYIIYENLASRVRVILDKELLVLENEMERQILQHHEGIRSSDSQSMECLRKGFNSSASIKSMSINVSVGQFEGMGENLARVNRYQQLNESVNEMTILSAKPILMWKYEKNKNDIDSSSIPCDAAFLEKDRMVVICEYDNANRKNNRLQIFNVDEGKPINSLLQGQIQPLGVAVTRDQQSVVVTDCKEKRVKIVSLATGSVVAEIGKGQFGWPYGVAVNSKGHIIVSDAFNDSVAVFSAEGKKIRTFGSTGSHPEQFRNPYHVAVDSRDKIYVSDCGNNCVKVFNVNGKFDFFASDASRRFSATVDLATDRKSKNRKLKGPRGICVDNYSNIYVADDYSRVCMFGPTGNFIRYLLTEEEDNVKSPEGICYSPGGMLVVTEWNPTNLFCVKMFSLHHNHSNIIR